MVEKGFVDAIIRGISREFPGAYIIRPSDNFTLGVPDILAWIPQVPDQSWSVAIEAKSLRPLMEDPFHKGRRTGRMLKHPFSGPQWSALCKMREACVDAFGLVRVSEDTAFRIEPEAIKEHKGNFTHEELVKFGRPVSRAQGAWRFWEEE